jgi:hypothetical protein
LGKGLSPREKYISLNADAGINRRAETMLTALRRGKYNVEASDVWVYDWFGTFRFRVKKPDSPSVLILPAIRPIYWQRPESFGTGGMYETSGMPGVSGFEDNTEYNDLRQYLPTDSANRIHWKASARKNDMMSKNYEPAPGRTAELIFDNSVIGPDDTTEPEDRMAEVFVSVASYFAKRSYSVYLRYPGWEHDPQADPHEPASLYYSASQIQFAGNDFTEFISSHSFLPQAEVCLFVQGLNEATVETAQKLRASGCPVTLFVFAEAGNSDGDAVEELRSAGAEVYDLISDENVEGFYNGLL